VEKGEFQSLFVETSGEEEENFFKTRSGVQGGRTVRIASPPLLEGDTITVGQWKFSRFVCRNGGACVRTFQEGHGGRVPCRKKWSVPSWLTYKETSRSLEETVSGDRQ